MHTVGHAGLRGQTFVLGIAGIVVALTLVGVPATALDSGWSTPTLIETDDTGSAGAPDIALDPAGNGIAVWEQYDGVSGFRYNILANRFVAGVGWGTATLIETNDTGDAYQPKIALDPAGNGIAVWHQYDGVSAFRYNVWANRYAAGVGWGTATLIETNDTGDAVGPVVALDPNGTGIAVWTQYDGFSDSIWANRFVPGTGWGTATVIETDDTGPAYVPHIALDPDGNGLAVWQQYDPVGFRYNIWGNRFAPETGWGTAILIETNDTGDARGPKVAFDPAGNGIAVWEQYDEVSSFRYNIWANRYVAGVGWGTPTLIETDDTGDASQPKIALDPDGNGIAVWEQYDGYRYNIWANRYVAGSGWLAATTLDIGGSDAYRPQVASDLDGNGIAVWDQYDGFRNSVWANRFVPGAGWGTATLIETDHTGDVSDVRVALDSNGHGIAVWGMYDGFNSNVWANRFIRDVVPPLVFLTSPTETMTRNPDVTVAGVTEPDARVTVNGGSVPMGADGSFSTTVSLVEGPNPIVVVAMDDEGNRATVTRTITRDTVPPGVAVSTPSEGARFTSSLIRVAGTVEAGAALSVHGLQIVPDGAGTWRVDLPLADGMHTIVVRAVDVAGNVATISRTMTVDTVVPEITLTSPTATLTRASTAMVSGVVSDASAAVTVNGAPVTVGPSGDFSMTVALVEGPNAIVIAATDEAGNEAHVTKSVTRDSTAPMLALSTPANGATLGDNVVRVSGTSEPGADLTVNGLRVVVGAAGAWSVDLGLAGGSNTITVDATDAAGNTATVSVTVTYVDPVPGIEREQGALGLQMLGVLVLLIASLALNGFLFVRYWTLRKKSPRPSGLPESPGELATDPERRETRQP
jgi:hypothetical protein